MKCLICGMNININNFNINNEGLLEENEREHIKILSILWRSC